MDSVPPIPIDLWGDQPPAEPHKKILRDKHRFVVTVAGRKFRKSSVTVAKLFKGAMTTPLTYPFIAPFRKQAKEIVWYDHLPRILTYLKAVGFPYKKNDSELFIEFPWGGRFKVDGSDNQEALRGIGNWGGLGLTEYADWKTDVWQTIIRPNLMTTKAWAIIEGTPKGFNHFHRLAKSGDHDNIIEGEVYDEYGQTLKPEEYLDQDFQTFRYTSYDNPYLDKSEIEAARRNTTKAFFDQEYLAKFTKFTGLVYKEFGRATHVIEPFDIPESWTIYRALDFGSTNPTACLWIGVDGDSNWYVVGEHYATGQTIDYHAGLINSHPLSARVSASYGDPSGAQWITEFAQRGVYITPANKEVSTAFNTWVRLGIDKVAQKLKPIPGRYVPAVRRGDVVSPAGQEGDGVRVSAARDDARGMPALFIFSGCTNTIREFETYRWKEKAVTQAQDLNEPDVPEKANDHALDALRYFAVSYQKQEAIEPPKLYRPADSVIGV